MVLLYVAVFKSDSSNKAVKCTMWVWLAVSIVHRRALVVCDLFLHWWRCLPSLFLWAHCCDCVATSCPFTRVLNPFEGKSNETSAGSAPKCPHGSHIGYCVLTLYAALLSVRGIVAIGLADEKLLLNATTKVHRFDPRVLGMALSCHVCTSLWGRGDELGTYKNQCDCWCEASTHQVLDGLPV